MMHFARQAGTRICGKTGLEFEEILCRRPDRFGVSYIIDENHNKAAR